MSDPNATQPQTSAEPAQRSFEEVEAELNRISDLAIAAVRAELPADAAVLVVLLDRSKDGVVVAQQSDLDNESLLKVGMHIAKKAALRMDAEAEASEGDDVAPAETESAAA